jgi:nucleotide-binding universal stress UspA family protein
MGERANGTDGLTGDRLLLCVDGSSAALAAARLAIDMVQRHTGSLRAICVVDTEHPAEALRALESIGGARLRDELERDARAVLAHVAAMARSQGVEVETVLAQGDPARRLLEEARAWGPDLILLGRIGRHGPGSRILGQHAARVLEFSEWPVIVVPAPDDASG